MIYDCFPFNNELDLLEIRLNHHDPFVDKFVLTESPWAYSGLPKRLHYDEVKDQEPFARFKDKIIHIVYGTPPNGKSNWGYEHNQRNYLRDVMVPIFKEDDLIFYLDCDEIIRSKKVVDQALGMGGIVTLEMGLYWYYFNCIIKPGSEYQADYSMEQCFGHRWHMGKICRKRHLSQFKNLYELREYRLWESNPENTIFNAGWHFSNLGDPDSIYDKLMAFSHSAELNERYDLAPRLIEKRKAQLRDPLGRDVSFVPTELDAPQFVFDNAERYRELILNAPNN
jgi:beta-1,4-mannosyl-glycoprotein beta-1,4-N-acetylglucosaminyltransferase